MAGECIEERGVGGGGKILAERGVTADAVTLAGLGLRVPQLAAAKAAATEASKLAGLRYRAGLSNQIVQ